jgi:hypothetical protein
MGDKKISQAEFVVTGAPNWGTSYVDPNGGMTSEAWTTETEAVEAANAYNAAGKLDVKVWH